MHLHAFDSLTRHAAHQVSRRHSLRALGGAAVAVSAAALPQRAAARKKNGQNCEEKEQQRCANDTEACRHTVNLNCKTPGTCDSALRCCEQCTATGFMTCALKE